MKEAHKSWYLTNSFLIRNAKNVAKNTTKVHHIKAYLLAAYFYVGPMEWAEIIEADVEHIKKMFCFK